MTLDPLAVATVVGSLGAAWGGAKAAISNLRQIVTDHIEHDSTVQKSLADELSKSRLEVTDRLARIETKLDGLKK